MTKRASKENPKDRKCSEDMVDDDAKPPPTKRKKIKKDDDKDTLWINDDTLSPDEEQSSSSSSDDKPTTKPFIFNIEIIDPNEEDMDEDFEPEDEVYEEGEDEFLDYLYEKYVNHGPTTRSKTAKKKETEKDEKVPMELTKKEMAYYKSQPEEKRKELLDIMKRMSFLSLSDGETPHKFKVLQLPISDYVKSTVIKKINAIEDMGNEAGESYKLRNWVDAFLRIPFGKTIPLPVRIEDGRDRCTQFMVEARKLMDKSIYGMLPAKTQIMQILAQLIVNPTSVGNVIALQGPMGVGKTSLARNAIADVMKRPFEFFSLGGASDISNFIGHSYTYEGSMWGRIADSVMHAGSMNPVMYFDELDKVSTTPHGDEIISMLIHLTDRSQNSQFHDRYFSGVDFNLSQCLFVFSFNDIEKVHPILRDRMTIINCGGYNENDKKVILKDYIWPQMIDRLKFTNDEVVLTDEAIKYLISEYSADEKGVRTLIRMVEGMMTRLNMLRILDDESMKTYDFYIKYTSPFVLTESTVKKILTDLGKKEPELWRSLYN